MDARCHASGVDGDRLGMGFPENILGYIAASVGIAFHGGKLERVSCR
jgi:hypothetical protein